MSSVDSAVKTSPVPVIPCRSEVPMHIAGGQMPAQTTSANSIQHRAADLSERPLTFGTVGVDKGFYYSGDRNSQ